MSAKTANGLKPLNKSLGLKFNKLNHSVSLYWSYWHCLHTMRRRVCVLLVVCPSVRPSVCLSHHSTAAAVCGGFAAEHRAGRRYRSTTAGAGAQQQRRRSTALSSKCWQCHVDSRVDEAEHWLVFYYRKLDYAWNLHRANFLLLLSEENYFRVNTF